MGKVVNLHDRRNARDAELYRLLQAEELMIRAGFVRHPGGDGFVPGPDALANMLPGETSLEYLERWAGSENEEASK